MRYLGVAFLFLAILEFLSIVLAVHWLGVGLTLLWIIGTFFVGAWMLRNSGFSALLMAFAAMRSGEHVSLYQLLWPVRYTLAACFLMSPGLFSDLAALVLLLPIQGKPIAPNRDHLNGHFHYYRGPFGQNRTDNDDIIEGEYTVRSGGNKTDGSAQNPNRLSDR